MKLRNGPFPPSYIVLSEKNSQNLLDGAHSHPFNLIFLPCVHRYRSDEACVFREFPQPSGWGCALRTLRAHRSLYGCLHIADTGRSRN